MVNWYFHPLPWFHPDLLMWCAACEVSCNPFDYLDAWKPPVVSQPLEIIPSSDEILSLLNLRVIPSQFHGFRSFVELNDRKCFYTRILY